MVGSRMRAFLPRFCMARQCMAMRSGGRTTLEMSRWCVPGNIVCANCFRAVLGPYCVYEVYELLPSCFSAVEGSCGYERCSSGSSHSGLIPDLMPISGTGPESRPGSCCLDCFGLCMAS